MRTLTLLFSSVNRTAGPRSGTAPNGTAAPVMSAGDRALLIAFSPPLRPFNEAGGAAFPADGLTQSGRPRKPAPRCASFSSHHHRAPVDDDRLASDKRASA